ncbi:MAG: hypothetical protein ABII64_07460 [Elusimicrobiota bacterium]
MYKTENSYKTLSGISGNEKIFSGATVLGDDRIMLKSDVVPI